MSKHFITGAARSVTNSVERLTELRKSHPEWDDRPSEKALARERLLKPRSMPRGALRDWSGADQTGRPQHAAAETLPNVAQAL